MSNESENKRIDLTQFEGHTEGNWCISDDGNGVIKTDEFWIRLFEPYCDDGITEDEDTINKELMVSAPDLIAELRKCYKQNDLLTKAFMMAGQFGCYMTICEECDDIHTLDDECPFICEYCHEKDCECPASE